MTTNLTYPVDIADSKESMKTFFAEQTEFTDYNFEGSATSQLMNVLAYAHQSLIYYLNQTVNDLTLKNAEIQDNIRKLSDMLNYLPKRNSAPYISVDLSRSASHTINIPAFSTWTMGSLSLVNVEDITIADDDTHTVQLYEGTLTNETFYSDGTIFQTFDLTNVDKVDNKVSIGRRILRKMNWQDDKQKIIIGGGAIVVAAVAITAGVLIKK